MAGVESCDVCSERLREEEEKQQRVESAMAAFAEAVDPEYRATDIDHPNFPKSLYFEAKRNLNNHTMMGFVGASGKGKSRVAAILLKQCIWTGKRVHWVNCMKLQGIIQNDRDKLNDQVNLCRYRDVILLDDLGSMSGTQAVCNVMYEIIEERIAKRKLTIWTSNESVDEFFSGTSTDKQRARCISRISGYSRIYEI